MKIVVDENIPLGIDAFEGLGEVVSLPGRGLEASHIRGAEILVLRSQSRIDRRLLDGSSVRFVGTCTIGTDHMDLEYLAERGIGRCSAPGCNARSVAEWVAMALAFLHRAGKVDLASAPCLGLIGAGRVGTAVAALWRDLGFSVRTFDPPRQAVEGSEMFSSLDEVLACPVVSAHLPAVETGPWPTRSLLGENLHKLPPHGIFLNAGRGSTLHNAAFLEILEARPDLLPILDVFDPEPAFPEALVQRATLATPHVAGHSFEGKVEGTRMVREAVGAFLGAATWTPPILPQLELDAADLAIPGGVSPSTDPWDALASLLLATHDIGGDDARLRQCLGRDEATRGAHFDRLRKEYPIRREWRHHRIRHGDLLPEATRNMALRLGFPID